ncbi:MAG: dynamin family protein, partial [Betaproteobacteria bacterium]|nr:dynamin family protein [Betaproteobacteria bacterium]
MTDPTRPTPSSNHWSRFGAWRDQRLARLSALGGWLADTALDTSLWQEALGELERRLQHDQAQLAFVAELSRGKSELINALFFGASGQRVLPAGAGRTTMCPLEISSEPGRPSTLRLLPIETRAESRLLSDWKSRPQEWQEHGFAADDAVAMSRALQHLCDTVQVPLARARELGLHLPEGDEDERRDPDEQVEIPRWRHALLTIEHPLLAQGISVLDTPGLNALGAEPELTLSLIPSAAAVVFLLSADAGVTRSDLQLWNEHIGAAGRERSFIVLNKIDMLWDPLRSAAEVQAQIRKQCESVAQVLQVPLSRVFPLSAHKGLLARIHGDETLLQRSGLPQLEAALGECADRERRDWLEGSWRATLLDTRQRLERDVDARV